MSQWQNDHFTSHHMAHLYVFAFNAAKATVLESKRLVALMVERGEVSTRCRLETVYGFIGNESPMKYLQSVWYISWKAFLISFRLQGGSVWRNEYDWNENLPHTHFTPPPPSFFFSFLYLAYKWTTYKCVCVCVRVWERGGHAPSQVGGCYATDSLIAPKTCWHSWSSHPSIEEEEASEGGPGSWFRHRLHSWAHKRCLRWRPDYFYFSNGSK